MTLAEGWTVDTLATHIERQLDDMRAMLQERYMTQTKAVDAAFIASQTAMQTALANADRQVQTALTASEKAISAANAATDKRFEVLTIKLEEMDARNQASFREMRSGFDTSTARSAGISWSWSTLLGLLVAAAAVGMFIIALKK